MTGSTGAGSWFAAGACREIDADLWFPDHESGRAIKTATNICMGCGVRTECLQYALDHREKGLWGGTTENQRRALLRKPRTLAA